MKNQALFSSKDKSKKLKCRLLQLLFGALRVNFVSISIIAQVTQSAKKSVHKRTLFDCQTVCSKGYKNIKNEILRMSRLK